MISEERVEAAVAFIRDNAEKLGQLTGRAKALEYRAKVIKAQAYLDAEGTIQARESEALCTTEYKQIIDEIENCFADRTTLETKIRAAELTIETWRSQNKWADRGHL